jgi:hypothetical protein
MSNTNYTPGLGNLPFGNTNTNPQSSQYAGISGYSPAESILIAKAIKRAIFDAAPAQYNALKLLYAKPFEDVNNDEFEYLESTFGRSALVSNAIVAAVAAVPGTPAAQTLTLTAASMTKLTPDLIIIYPDNTKAVIRSVTGATTIAVESQTSGSLPGVAVGDIFAVQSTIMADAMDYFSNYERMETVTRYNFVQFFLRAARWGRIELQKFENSGTTDFLVRDKEQKLKQLRVDLFNSFFNGNRGEFQISNGYIAKSMGGIYPTMVAAGSMSANPTVAGLKAAFEALAFATNYKQEGATRFIYGCEEILYELSKVWKEPGVRYTPSDEIANLNLNEYKIGTMRFVPVNCELFRESSCFPADWKRKLLIIDQETITPMKMKGIPALEMGSTLDRQGDSGSRENFKDWWVGGQLSLRMDNPLSSFWLDVQ